MIGTKDFEEAAKWVTSRRRPLLLTHTRPDGDAVGSLASAHTLLRRLGAEPLCAPFDPLPDRYVPLAHHVPMRRWGDEVGPEQLGDRDAIIILDTCSFSQLEPASDWLRQAPLPTLVVDHHATRDAIGDVRLVDESAAATCLILFEWAKAANWTIDAEAASALFAGIATDTGWFHHANTDARVLAAAAQLARRGAKPHALFEHLYQRESHARFRLRAAAADRLQLSAAGRLAVTTLPRALFDKCGAALSDSEDLVNEPLRIGSVVISVLLVEQGDGVVRAGFRSREPAGGDFPDIDVSVVAAEFGGGGHRRAAGARFTGPLEEVRDGLTARLERLLAG